MSNINEKKIINDFNTILNDKDVKIVVETMGGLKPAFEFVSSCLKAGKSVVTSNKELVAAKGAELIKIAKENNANFLFEASVGGGIPIIRPLQDALTAEVILSVCGIVNGTTNYILSSMEKDQLSFDESLSKAQSFGYAELNPESDVLGYDTVRKIAILGETAWHHEIDYKKIPTIGITNISADDIKLANNAGYCIKLIGNIQRKESKTILRYLKSHSPSHHLRKLK